MSSSSSTNWHRLDLSSHADATTTARLPPPLLLAKLTAVAVAAPQLARAGLPRMQRWLEPSHRKRLPEPSASTVDQYGRWVDSVIRRGQPVVRRGCLTRGISLYYGLRRAGVEVSLCFGMGVVGGQMEGHCWVETDGRPLLEPFDPRQAFAEVARISRAGVTEGVSDRGGMAEWKPPTD